MENEAVTGFYSPVLTSYLVFCLLKAPALKAFKEGQISPYRGLLQRSPPGAL